MTLLRLAFADLLHDRVLAACNIAAIMGVVAPLAILFGIKAGVIGALMADLRSDPDMLRVTVPGDRGFEASEIAEVRTWMETGFVAPSSRAIARRLLVRREGGGTIRRAALIATGPGEPLLPEAGEPQGREVAVSAGLSRRLGVSSGAVLEASAARGDPVSARLSLRLQVSSVIPAAVLDGEAMLLRPELIESVEAFYDGYALPDLGVTEGRPLATREARYESLRVYAADLASVLSLERRLERRFGLEARSRAAEVLAARRLERRLDLALGLIGAAGIAGLLGALAASFWGMVRSRRGALAALAMLGMPPRRLAGYTIWLALLTALAGLVAAGLAALAGAGLAEALFADRLPEGTRFLIPPGAAAAGAALVLAVSALAAFLAAREAARIEPGAVFRNV